MRTKEQRREKLKKCRHFNGVRNKVCKSKFKYPPYELACFGDFECDGYNPLTPEELDAQEAEIERHLELMAKGLSSCCEAPFNTSQVITSGQFKGHGPRFCSKCGELAFMV